LQYCKLSDSLYCSYRVCYTMYLGMRNAVTCETGWLADIFNVCIMCHYIQLKMLTAENFYWIVYISINTRVWHKFQCCHRYCCYMLCISYVTLMKSLCSKMHLHSNSIIFMEFITTTFTVYCAYQDFELQLHVMKMKSSACKRTKLSIMHQVAVTWFLPYTLTGDI
jgi:hypothetical protein